MKKICLLFACAGLITFTANAQEGKRTKDPVKVAPAIRPVSEAPSVKPENNTVAETTPHSDIQPTTKPVVRENPARPQTIKKAPAKALVVPNKRASDVK